MATITKNSSGNWKAIIRRQGNPTVIKTFRVKRDAENWARSTEDEIVRGIYVHKANSEKLSISDAIDRYLKEVTPTKKESTQKVEVKRAVQLKTVFGKYSLATLSSAIIAKYRDERLESGIKPNTICLLYTSPSPRDRG